jgi:ATP/maltotriose-dependent transcriptional regulator MalT
MVQATAPQVRQPKIIERPRLTRQLDECGARVILLIAPAGYGKTTLARQWLTGKPHAWCALSAADRDVAALATEIAIATRVVVPDAGVFMQTRLGLSSQPSSEIEIFAEMLASDLSAWPESAWLAIDDYHSVAGANDCESFVEAVLRATPMRIVITSRSRPAWATPRSRAYGAHYEVDQRALAMTEAEAQSIIVDPTALELAQGWPAVLGLAASLEKLEPRTELRDSVALHSFVAEELLKNAPPKVRRSLFRLSLCPDVSLAQARAILGAGRVASLVERSAKLGLVSMNDGLIVIHPLVRQFIRQWHHAHDPSWPTEVRYVACRLIREKLWDAAFALIEDSDEADLLNELLSSALAMMLESGRHSTIETWVAYARNTPLKRSSWVLLAEAEVASRRGDQHRAQALSVQAARATGDTALRVRAWNLAGRSAHLLDNYPEANEYHRLAESLATTDKERYDALWGQIVASWQFNPSQAAELVAPIARYADPSIDAQLRLVSLMFQDGLQRGAVGHLEDRIRESLILANRAANPLVASSFFVIASRWCATTGNYDDALRVVDETIALAERHRLSFVLPSALTVRGMALVGLRKWGEASRALSAADAHAHAFDDVHNQVDAHVIRMRLCLSRGHFGEALKASEATWQRDPGPIEMCEFEATCELARAVAGVKQMTDRSRRCAVPPTADTMTLELAARAIRALKQHRHSAGPVSELRNHVLKSGCVDGFLIASRAYPELLCETARDDEFMEYIKPILQRARDVKLSRSVGLDVGRLEKTPLTPREREVHELLAQGLTNKAIAKLLYVEEVTVKVHVRHILSKLGVRSRVEAATKFTG